MNQRKLRELALDVLEQMYCTCNDDGNPKLCECGGDGIEDNLEGCWKCQAYTALNGYGKVPRVTRGGRE